MAPPEILTYRADGTDPIPIQQEFTYALAISGPQGLTTQLLAANPALSVQQLRASRKGRRMIAAAPGGSRVEVQIAGAHVEARTRDKTVRFDFDQSTVIADLAQDPIRQFAWGFSMGGQKYLLGKKGQYRLENNNDDGQAEPMAVILNVPVGLPDHEVHEGDEWTSEWTGLPRKKDGATVRFRQTARLADVAAGQTPRARITFTTSGTLNVPADKNIQGEEMTLAGKGSILLDLQSGLVVASDSSGTITTDIKKAGIQIVHTLTSKTDTP